MLNEIERAGLLKHNSEIRDLGLVMCVALKWADCQSRYEIDDSELGWRRHVISYVRKGNIDIAAMPVSDARRLLEDVKRVRKLTGKAKSDRWYWRNKVRVSKCSQSLQ